MIDKNKFLVSFKLGPSGPPNGALGQAFSEERIRVQEEIRAWCKENIGHDESYPHWQFAGGGYYFYDERDRDALILHSGIYIFDDAARIAFKLRYGL